MVLSSAENIKIALPQSRSGKNLILQPAISKPVAAEVQPSLQSGNTLEPSRKAIGSSRPQTRQGSTCLSTSQQAGSGIPLSLQASADLSSPPSIDSHTVDMAHAASITSSDSEPTSGSALSVHSLDVSQPLCDACGKAVPAANFQLHILRCTSSNSPATKVCHLQL